MNAHVRSPCGNFFLVLFLGNVFDKQYGGAQIPGVDIAGAQFVS